MLNIFPTAYTTVCATSVRTFNECAAATGVLRGIENVVSASAFRSSFDEDELLINSPMLPTLVKA